MQRVYFTGYPDDCALYFEALSQQILERQNCAVFYEEDPESPADAENFESDLSRMQLIVIPVSSRFLYRDCFARRVVFPFAMQRHIPVLPIMVESGLSEEFNRICGDLQCLDLNARDETAISYDDKLTRYLNSVLIGDETAQKVRDAFDAYIFLSYRKKDRRFAQELMRLIHKNDFCRDIAIWYDEFLVPGESFNQAIQEAIKKSELFALVVTPNLLEQGNYVMRHEYPDANSAGMKILPAELQPTDRETLEQHFDAIPACVDSHNQAALADSLSVLLENVAKPDNDDDPTHNFFIGLAYLGGIDVETDYDMALRLIEGAAERELPEALQKLVDMYNSGEGVKRDYHKAIAWQRRLADVRKKLFEADPTEENAQDWLNALWVLGDALQAVGKPKDAGVVFVEMLHGTERCEEYHFSFVRRYQSISYNKLGDICKAQGRLAEAQQYYEQSLQIAEQLAGETGTVEARCDLSVSYNNLGDICKAQGRLTEAQQYYEQSLQIDEQLAEETGTVEARRDLSISYNNLGDICEAQGGLTEAQQYYEQSLQIFEQLAEETGTVEARRDLSISYSYVGDICEAQGGLTEAQQYYERSLQIREQLAEETGTVEARRNLSLSYSYVGDICNAQGRLAEAQRYYEQSLQIFEQLAGETGTVQARRDLSISYEKLGDICKAQGRVTEAQQYYEQSLQIREQLAEETGTVEARRDLSITYDRLGSICKAQGRLSEAQQYFEQSLQIREQLAEETGTVEARRDLSVCYHNLGDICEAQGRLTEAQRFYEQMLQIAEQLAEETGTVQSRRDLSVSYNNLGEICEAQGRLTDAQQYFEQSLQIDELLAEETGTVEAYDDLAISHYNLGFIAQRVDDKKAHFSAALRIWEQLAAQCPDVPEYAKNRDMAKKKLEEL